MNAEPLIIDITDDMAAMLDLVQEGIEVQPWYLSRAIDVSGLHVLPVKAYEVIIPDEMSQDPDSAPFEYGIIDFVVSFNKDIEPAKLYDAVPTAGQVAFLGRLSGDQFYPVLVYTEDDQVLPAGEEYRLLKNSTKTKYDDTFEVSMDYDAIYTDFFPFYCGIVTKDSDDAFSLAHQDDDWPENYGLSNRFFPGVIQDLEPGTKVTIKFVVFEVANGQETGERVVLDTQTYTLK